MRIANGQLGEIDVRSAPVLRIAGGLIGFEDHERYYVIDGEGFAPFRWIVSVDDPELAFAVVDPAPFLDEPYEVALTEADRLILDLRSGEDFDLLVLVSPGDRGEPPTLNLKGPIAVTPDGTARQILVYSSRAQLRHPTLKTPERSGTVGRARLPVRPHDRRAA